MEAGGTVTGGPVRPMCPGGGRAQVHGLGHGWELHEGRGAGGWKLWKASPAPRAMALDLHPQGCQLSRGPEAPVQGEGGWGGGHGARIQNPRRLSNAVRPS